jgi:hypothetical protein
MLAFTLLVQEDFNNFPLAIGEPFKLRLHILIVWSLFLKPQIFEQALTDSSIIGK